MDRIGRFTVMLAAVTLPWIEPDCPATPQSAAASAVVKVDDRSAASPARRGIESRRFPRRGRGRAAAAQDMPAAARRDRPAAAPMQPQSRTGPPAR